jgi:pimeloyl-ACP methyl ester carboxylesterase
VAVLTCLEHPAQVAGLVLSAGVASPPRSFALRRAMSRITPELCGSKDRANIPLSRELAEGIPGAELRIVPDATHLWNLQQPEAFNVTVAEFVDWAGAPVV